jgi:hypothetical protein
MDASPLSVADCLDALDGRQANRLMLIKGLRQEPLQNKFLPTTIRI